MRAEDVYSAVSFSCVRIEVGCLVVDFLRCEIGVGT